MKLVNVIVLILSAAASSEAFSAPQRLVTPKNGIHDNSMFHRQSFALSRMNHHVRVISSSLHMSDTAVSIPGDDEESAQKGNGMWNKLKAIVPPANERQKLIPLALMFFCILFSYTILRDTKDVLMITAPKSGAEVIPFIKTYVNLPVAIVSIKTPIVEMLGNHSKLTSDSLHLSAF
jgi:TLC ATP/ADP transporter